MMKVLGYFERWSRTKGQPANALSCEQARVRHHAGDAYVAVLLLDKGKCVVDLAGDWVSVLFFDSLARLYTKYDFKRMEPGRVFLSAAMYMEHEGESMQAHTAVTFAFRTDGAVTIEKRDMLCGEVHEKETVADAAVNWDVYPEFGDYGSICRLERM